MYTGLNFEGYKLFPPDNLVELNELSNTNVIIGKNNSGKSSLLDVIEMAYSPSRYGMNRQQIDSFMVDIAFTEEMVQSIFGNMPKIGRWTPETYWNAVKAESVWVELTGTKNLNRIENVRLIKDRNKNIPLWDNAYFKRIRETIRQLINQYEFRRLSAERNILPESEGELELSSTGEGASNLIRVFINDSSYDESIIEETLLDALNEIMSPEAHYENIRIQQVDINGNQKWEVYLKEDNMNRIALSNSGSGLKTIILVLLNLMAIPELPEYKDKKIAYGFEELENNLHPAMQRKLFDYIYNYAIHENIQVYFTTHSHVAINMFCDKEKSYVYHVVKKSNQASVQEVSSFIDKAEILDDLDAKASDILQSNGIIWVEGPSDRIYIKRWLEVFCDNEYEEGKDYQFLYYGGRLLSHYSTEENSKLINILTTNRNAAIIMDSDKRNQSAKINKTKGQIRDEFKELNMFCWITKGKEIENYLPMEAIENMIGRKINKQIGKYDLFPEYIAPYYKSFESRKVEFANKVKDYITKENSASMYGLQGTIISLYEHIKKWNE